jgi:hypothetical protein
MELETCSSDLSLLQNMSSVSEICHGHFWPRTNDGISSGPKARADRD